MAGFPSGVIVYDHVPEPDPEQKGHIDFDALPDFEDDWRRNLLNTAALKRTLGLENLGPVPETANEEILKTYLLACPPQYKPMTSVEESLRITQAVAQLAPAPPTPMDEGDWGREIRSRVSKPIA